MRSFTRSTSCCQFMSAATWATVVRASSKPPLFRMSTPACRGGLEVPSRYRSQSDRAPAGSGLRRQRYKILPRSPTANQHCNPARSPAVACSSRWSAAQDEGGDGTVPFVSAIPIEFSSDAFVDEVHFVAERGCGDHTRRRRCGLTIGLGGVRDDRVAVALGVGDAYTATDPAYSRHA